MFTWIPTYLKKERDLTIVGTSGYLFVVIAGAFLRLPVRGLRARPARAPARVRAVRRLAGVSLVAYFAVPSGSNTMLLLVGFPLGFFASGCFSGFGSYLSELYPTRARATGGGFCYNVGRGLGALFPGIIGFLAAAIGLGGAIAFGVFGYVLAMLALTCCPRPTGARSGRSSELVDALRGARAYDLEQPRFAGAPVLPAHEPGVILNLHRRHERDAPESRTSASAMLVMTEHSGHAHRRALPPGLRRAAARRRRGHRARADPDRLHGAGDRHRRADRRPRRAARRGGLDAARGHA